MFLKSQQKPFILIDSQTKKEFPKKDSISAVKFLDSLAENNYYFTKIINVEKNNSTTKIIFDKGKNFNQAEVKISPELAEKLHLKSKFFTKNLDSLKRNINENYRNQGFAFNRVKTKFLGMQQNIPKVQISVIADQQRKIDGFVLKGYEKVPKRFIKNLEKEFQGKIYDDKNLVAINKSLQNHPFITLEKPPQTLFTKDSTQVFLFMQKKKSNSFDGMIGFGNDKSEKFTINGSINVQFRNMFNGFEAISIFWQRNPDKGQTFDLQTDVPYFFGSNLGFNANLNIYRQDSTFATLKFLPSVYYHLSNRQKIGLRATLETSTVVSSNYLGDDFSKKGVGIWYNYEEPTEIELFMHTTKIRFETDLLSTYYAKLDENAAQTRYYFYGERNFWLKGNHYLNLKAESAMLNSKIDFTSNELLRFGGWNSLRGFNENSLLANFYAFGGAEYRYVIGKQAFFDVFGQYAQLNNQTIIQKPKLYSFGLGFNFFLPIGLMTFQISNGNQFGNPLKFGDTKIHWGILSRF